jgi:hypothetical protein
MARDTSITAYVNETTKSELQREADERDMSFSSYLLHLIDRGRTAEAEEHLTSRTDAEAAIERVVQETVEDYHADLLAALEKSSVYSIANFELLAGTDGFDVSGARRDDVFSTGRRRTHTPLSEHSETMAADSATDDTSPETEPEPSSEGDSGSGGGFSLSELRDE